MYRARRSRAGTLSLIAPFASKPGASAGRNQDVNRSGLVLNQAVQEAGRLRPESCSVASNENTRPSKAVPGRLRRSCVVNARCHRSPPTFSKETFCHSVGNANQMNLLTTDHASLGLSKLDQRQRQFMTCPHVESLRTRRRIVHLLQKLWIAAPKALWIRDRASAAGEELL